jgi:hypothetical protein
LNPKIFARLAYRSWYYFRLGYATYLTFILGYVSTLITVYYLAIKNIPALLGIFPKFELFAVPATVVGVPLSVAVGWIHLKRSHLFSSETDVSVEANPYNYKMAPGKETVLSTPMMLIQLRILRRLAETNGLLNGQEKDEIDGLENTLLTLLKGGYVGKPRRKANF